MKNLSLYDVTSKKLKFEDAENLLLSFGYSENSASGEVYSCSSNLIVSKFNEQDELAWSKALDDVASPDNSPVDITVLTLTNAACVGFTNGEIITIGDSGNSCDLAGVCDNGLQALEWSPDQELLVLVTKNFDSILMSCTFDLIHEVNLLKEEFGEKQFMTVGWGKKETQFHGSEGKSAAKMKTEVHADPNIESADKVKITWRGDGQLYAVGFTMDGIRRFKVFDREGHLQYTSEKQPGIETNLAWRPSGNVIATTQKLPESYDVTFFEKNGLKHGGFNIPVTNTTEVLDLVWSSDSEVLALLCHETVNNTYQVLVFTSSNYHWYLKQSLNFDDKKVMKMFWDNDFDVANNKRLHIVLNNGQHLSYNWIWNVDHSEGKTHDDDAVVAVIDRHKLLLTGFRQLVVPPPMAAAEIQVESPINSVHFAPSSREIGSNNFFIYTSDSKLIFYKQTCKHPLAYEKYNTVELDKEAFPLQSFNWRWMNDTTLVCVRVENSVYNVLEYQVNGAKLELTATTLLPAAATRVQSHPKDDTKLVLQLINGEIVHYGSGGEISPLDVAFPVSCPKLNSVLIDEAFHILGLTHKGSFYIDDALVLNNVNSFFVHTHFLLLTTLGHVILCIELSQSGLNALKNYKTNESSQVYKRKVERGSKLVISVPNDTRTVLQMPRGNLEAIQPRPLTLKIIGEYLNNLKYYEAFDLMRKQRINLNLIYDHNPNKFIDNIDVFLNKIENNTWLNLFISELDNIDVTQTMYASNYSSNDLAQKNVTEKIEHICNVMSERLISRPDYLNKILPMLTIHVKKNKMEELESALSIVKCLKYDENKGNKTPVTADEALKYLLYMVDVNQLFDVALGMYDFDLVLFVANKSQKDPKEYVPLLNEFNKMDHNYKQFSINKHLKRFDRAVKCLAACGTTRYEELIAFVKYHSLYKQALQLFTAKDDIYQQLSEDFGQYLKLKKQFTEAGIVFRNAKCYDKAIECFKIALEWEFALELAHGWDKEKLQELCWDLVTGLRDEKRHDEALTILQVYHGGVEEIITYAIECSKYRTAIRLCSQHKRDELKESKLLPSLQEEYKNLSELVESNWTTFIRHRERLRVVREEKRKAPVAIHDPDYENRDSDLYSDAGSTVASSASRSSSRTFRSSKNRRKHERKVASLKEGSQYESVALVIALHNLVTSSFDLRPLVREVNLALAHFGRENEASLLQRSVDKLYKDMRESFKEIWSYELMLEATNASIAALEVPEGCSAVPQGIASLDHHMRIAPVISEMSWKLEGLD